MTTAHACIESCLPFDCEGKPLLGIVSQPAVLRADVGVVVVVGGPQYRAGAHRQFTLLARHLAASGYAVLRFDVRGMGDSAEAAAQQRSFEALDADVHAAISALLQAQPGLKRVVLWGLCDGASAALLALHARTDARVAGLCLLNPWVRSAASLAKTQVKHYYRQRLQQPDFWRKLLRGAVAGRALRDLAANLRAALGGQAGGRGNAGNSLPFQQRMALAWLDFAGPVLLLLSERDATAQEFIEYTAADPHWQRALKARPPQRVTLSGADHTCSSPAAQRAAEHATAAWLTLHFAEQVAA